MGLRTVSDEPDAEASDRFLIMIRIKPDPREVTMSTKLQLPFVAAKLAANVARERLAPGRVTS